MKIRSVYLSIACLIAISLLTPVRLRAQEQDHSPAAELVNYYFVLLTRGGRWTPEKTPQTEQIQQGHLDNIKKLHDAGKLVLAGPFTDTGNWRGIFILKASSLEEANLLVQTDPAVQAGRLSFEIHPWATKKGMLPD